MDPVRKRKNILYIVLPVIAAAVILGVAAVYYYFFYLAEPNLVKDSSNNYLKSDSSGTVRPGDEITYTVNLENSGKTVMEDIRLLTVLPDNTSLVGPAGRSLYDKDTGSLEINLGDIEPGNTARESFTVAVMMPCDDGKKIESQDINIEFYSRSEKKTFLIESDITDTVESSPVLEIRSMELTDKNGEEINSGDILSIELELENSGDMIARDTVLEITLNDNLNILNAHTGQEVKEISTGYLAWEIGSIEPGQIQDLAFEAAVLEGLEDGSDLEITAGLGYGDNTVDTKVVEGEVTAYADLSSSSIEVSDINGGSLWAGDTIRYTMTLINTGLDSSGPFTVYCPSPDNTFYVSGSGTPEGISWSDDIRGITWYVEEGLEIGEEMELSLDFSISTGLTGGGLIEDAFYIIEGDKKYGLQPSSLSVRSYIFQTIVAMGDSHIVHTNWQNTLDSLLESTYPRAEFNTIGSGVPQEMAYQGVRRFDSTVAIYNPQVIIIGYGTNDTGGGISLFRNGLTELVNKAKATGATVLVHSIGYIDKVKRPAKKSFLSYNEVIKEVCRANGVPYIDLYTPMASDPGRYLDSDGMHWSAEGGNLLGHLVFNTLTGYLDQEGRRK